MQNNAISAAFNEEEFNQLLINIGIKEQKVLKVSPYLYAYLSIQIEKVVKYKDNILPTFCSVPVELDWNLTDYNYKFENKQ